jgi:tetratricopeptide (TPR) repeat protein
MRSSAEPNFALAQGYYGLSLSYSGRWQDGDKAAGLALRLSPRDPYSALYMGIAAYAQFLGSRYEEAMRLAREASVSAPISSAHIGF